MRHAGLSERAAAAVLEMGTGAAVNQQLAKWRRAVSAEGRWRELETELERQLGRTNF